MTRYGITEDYDYNATHKRHRLDLWSGPFRDQHEGYALSTTTGYTVWPTYGDKFRVACPSPRDVANYREVDAAINRALVGADRPGEATAHTHECTYCASYAVNKYTGKPTGSPRFTGSWLDVVTHADVHPIGDPRDMARRIDTAD